LPLVGSSDPLGQETPRIALLAAGLALILVNPPLRTRSIHRRDLTVWLLPLLFLFLFLFGLRGSATLCAAVPLACAALIAWNAGSLPVAPKSVIALAGALGAPAVVVAVQGLLDGTRGGEAVATFGNANRVGEYLATVLPVPAAIFILARHRGIAALGLVATVLLLAHAVVCKSRGGLLVGGIEVVLLVAVARRLARSGHLPVAPGPRLIGLAAALALGVAAIWITPSLRGHLEHAVERLIEGLSPTYRSNRVRIGVARGSARLVRDHPLGVGTGNFREAFVPYRDPVEHRISGWRSPVTHAHDQYLATAAETGWLGGILLVSVLGLLAWRLLRGLPRAPTALAGAVRATAGVTVVGVGLECLFATPFLNPTALFNLSVIGGFGAAAVTDSGDRSVRLPVRIGLLALTAALLAYCTAPAYRSYRARLRARTALEATDVNVAALQRAWRDAAEATPGSAEIWQQVGVWQARLGQREKAIASFDHALGLRPNFVACLLAKGDLLAQKQSFQAALEPVARAADLQPWNPDPDYLTGKIFAAAGYPDQAEAAFRRAIEADRAAYRGPVEAYRPTAVATQARAKLTERLMEKIERTERNLGRTAARSLLLEVLAIDPRHAAANLKLAVLLRQEEKPEEAARHRYIGKLETGLGLLRDALRNRAETPSRVVDRKFGEAIYQLRMATFEDRGNPEPYYYIAVVHALRNKKGAPWHDPDQARACLDEARKRGLYRLEDAPDGGRYREVVRPFWEGK